MAKSASSSAIKPMLFSVSYAGLWGQARLTVEEFIDKAGELGYPAVELMGKRPHLSPLDWATRGCRRLRRRAEQAGVEIATLAAYTDFTAGYAHREVPQIEIQVAYVERMAQMAAEMGARIVRVFTGYTATGASWTEQRQACLRAIAECADRAERYGVVIGVQNHHYIAVGAEDYEQFMKEIDHPNARAMFDPWSISKQAGVDLAAWAKRMAPHMVQATLADYERFPQYRYLENLINYERTADSYRAVPLGQGCIDNAAFIKGLKAGGFTGFLCYEMCSPLRGGGSLENLDATAQASLKFLKQQS